MLGFNLNHVSKNGHRAAVPYLQQRVFVGPAFGLVVISLWVLLYFRHVITVDINRPVVSCGAANHDVTQPHVAIVVMVIWYGATTTHHEHMLNFVENTCRRRLASLLQLKTSVSETGIKGKDRVSNYIPQFTVGYYYICMPRYQGPVSI